MSDINVFFGSKSGVMGGAFPYKTGLVITIIFIPQSIPTSLANVGDTTMEPPSTLTFSTFITVSFYLVVVLMPESL